MSWPATSDKVVREVSPEGHEGITQLISGGRELKVKVIVSERP